MGLTKRKGSWYVEFRVIDDGKVLKLGPGYGGKLKRWKVGSLNKTLAKQQEAVIKTRLISGQEPSPLAVRAKATTFDRWADTYLGLEEVRRLKSNWRRICVDHLRTFFRDRALGELTAEDVRKYRMYRERQGVSVQTVNHDHATLTHMLNVAMSEAFGLVSRNVASAVSKPNPNNERDRIATPEEWMLLRKHGAQHLI
jgi:integrase-like protein